METKKKQNFVGKPLKRPRYEVKGKEVGRYVDNRFRYVLL
jgi:hypothetical protein